mgnify:CR=1 FL=1
MLMINGSDVFAESGLIILSILNPSPNEGFGESKFNSIVILEVSLKTLQTKRSPELNPYSG